MNLITITGKSFCITGETEEYRDIYWALIVQAGGRWVSAVSGALDYLVVGAEPGPAKMRKAGELGVPCISEAELDAALRAALGIEDGVSLFSQGWNLPIENKLKYTGLRRSPVAAKATRAAREADDGISLTISGKRICITGKLDKTRAAYVALIEAAGGVFVGDVSGLTDYLIVGDKPGSKVKRAANLGVPVRSLGALKSALGED